MYVYIRRNEGIFLKLNFEKVYNRFELDLSHKKQSKILWTIIVKPLSYAKMCAKVIGNSIGS